jgi:hypothetical protein
MNEDHKPVESLQISDFQAFPVWEFVNDDELGETAVRPVQEVPVEDLNGRLVGTRILLANGERVWVSIGNVDTRNAKSTEHFLTLSVEKDGKWFRLARYHDFDYDECGPIALAAFLGLPVDEVFPISYDISMYAVGIHEVLVDRVMQDPRERLTKAELIAMAIGST